MLLEKSHLKFLTDDMFAVPCLAPGRRTARPSKVRNERNIT